MFMQRIFTDGLAQASFVVASEATREAVVIDPRRDVEVYLDIAAAHDLTIAHIFETHIHADYASGARELAARGAQLVELRLDYLSRAPELARLLKDRPTPCVVTCRRDQDRGRWRGSEEQRLALLRAAIAAGVEYVDLEEDAAEKIRRYGNTIAARIGQVRRDGLDSCVYSGAAAPRDKAPPASKAPRELPGEEYETATPPPPEPSVDETDVNALVPSEQAPPPEAPVLEQPVPAPETGDELPSAAEPVPEADAPPPQ